MNYGIFFLNNSQFSHVSYSYCNLSHMDGSLYHCFCVILIDRIGFLMRCILSVKPDVTFAQGIMVFWNITNGAGKKGHGGAILKGAGENTTGTIQNLLYYAPHLECLVHTMERNLRCFIPSRLQLKDLEFWLFNHFFDTSSCELPESGWEGVVEWGCHTSSKSPCMWFYQGSR